MEKLRINDHEEEEEEEEMEQSESLDSFIDDAFDGVASNVDRGACCDVLSSSSTAEFGLPMNLEDISTRSSNEFEATGEEITRNIAALEFTPAPEFSTAFNAMSSEFEVGASFQASSGLFASPLSSSPPSKSSFLELAPPLPFYLKTAPTSFRSSKSLKNLRSELEMTFAKCSVTFLPHENTCGYACSALRQLSLIEIDVNIYDADGKELLVELICLGGCRYAFGEVFDLIASSLGVCFATAKTSMTFCPPPLDDSMLLDDLPMPSPLSRSRDLEHEESMLSKDAPRDAAIQGARAAGLMAQLEALGNAQETDGGIDALFCKDGKGMKLASRVGELARDSSDDEVRTVAMAAVANIATLKHVCGKWLEVTIPTLVAGAKDDAPHVRREALRAMCSMSENDKAVAAMLVRAGAVPALELEANGGEDDQCPDVAMQTFAQSALLACRG